MTHKDIINQITGRDPVDQPASRPASSGGPGVWAALVTILGVLLILTVSTITAFQQSSRDQANTESGAEIARSYETILSEIRAAVQAGPADTEKAILALINDNRRIHGCKTVEAISQLASAPTCVVVTPVVTSTTSTTRQTPVITTVPPTTTPPTTPTTEAPKGSDKVAPGLLKKLVDLLL